MGDRRLRRSREVRRFLTMAALCATIALIALRASASVRPPQAGVGVADGSGGPAVTSVPVGGPAWLAGVRVGMPYHPWPDGNGGFVDTGALDVGVPGTYGTWPWLVPVAATVLLLGSVAVMWLLPTVGALGIVLTAAFVTNDLLGIVTAPMAWFVLLVPTLAFAATWRSRGRAARAVMVGAAMLCGALLLVLVVAPDAIPWSVSWWWVATTPALAALAFAGASLGVAAVRALRERRSEQPLSALLVGQTAAGRQAVMLAEESTRDRHARWLHDQVMPALTQASGDPDALSVLAEGLRDEVGHEQLAILEWGGLQAALETAGRGALANGLDWTLAIRQLGGDPPWPVQVASWRVAQEAIRNVIEHASADAIDVHGEVGASRVTVQVADDGVGLDEETQALARASGHIGVVSMLARARAVGATLAILPNLPTGTVVEFRWTR